MRGSMTALVIDEYNVHQLEVTQLLFEAAGKKQRPVKVMGTISLADGLRWLATNVYDVIFLHVEDGEGFVNQILRLHDRRNTPTIVSLGRMEGSKRVRHLTPPLSVGEIEKVISRL